MTSVTEGFSLWSRPMSLGHVAAMLLLFASWITLHVKLCMHLRRHNPKRAALAFFVMPLAPIWAQGTGAGRLVLWWVVVGVLYVVSLLGGMI